MFCKYCGNMVDDHAQVCSRCGRQLKSGSQPGGDNYHQQSEEQPVQGSYYQQSGAQPVQGGYYQQPEAQPLQGEDNYSQQSGAQPIQNGIFQQPGIEPGWDSGRTAGENPEMFFEDYPGGSKREEGKKGKPLIIFLIIAIILVIGAEAGFFLWTRLSKGKEADTQQEQELEDKEESEGEEGLDGDSLEDGEAEQPENGEEGNETASEGDDEVLGALSDSELSRTIAKYNQGTDSTVAIDVFADNYTPGSRNFSYTWDRHLFYSLEDINPASSADGKINGYDIARKMLRNAVSNNRMEYEIYSNPVTGKVNKIVSIEYFSDHLEITDYYYDDYGKASFIFVRDDINYIPSYAVPTKDGQRYYFNSDCMTKWRSVAGGVQTNYCVGQEAADANPAGSVFMYTGLDAGAQAAYDAQEKRMINAAYNTYNTVLAAEGVSEITGYVYNEAGGPEAGAEVLLVSEETGENLYRTKTDSSGMYRIVVPSSGNRYHLIINSGNYTPAMVYGVEVSGQTLSDFQSPVYMMSQSGQTMPVQVQVYDALHYASDGSGMERLGSAGVYIRDGVNHLEGGVVAQGTTAANGIVDVQLSPGMYTAEVVKSGFDNTYYNFAVKSGMEAVRINVSPKLAQGEVRIVLTWGYTPQDLDSHLFTPYDNVFGDTTYHIWYGNQRDAVGNNLDVDDTNGYGPETMTIPMLKNGLYKYYVADFTNCSRNNPSSYEMSNSGAVVDVYTSNGLTASFTVPSNRPGAIWEVFEIRNGVIVPIQRYYSNIEDKSWWHSDK